jgi:aminopeptidase YwaD
MVNSSAEPSFLLGGAREDTMFKQTVTVWLLLAPGVLGAPEPTTALLDLKYLRALIAETSGEAGLNHFRRLSLPSGFAPSRGAEQTADYLAQRAREAGLLDVRIDRFPSDGQSYFWTVKTEPWWEGESAELWLVEPWRERLASFAEHRVHLARFSRTASLQAELVDAGAGVRPADYEGKTVAGKIVLASGPMGLVHQRAVWERQAAGVLVYRTADHVDRPDLVSSTAITPWQGPRGEPPAFGFSVSHRAGATLVERLRAGEKLIARAEVRAETRAGDYPLVHATLRGTDPQLPEVWIYAHTNHRNTGGGNNLTGVGATVELSRALARLVDSGLLPRPRRNLHFAWGAEHFASLYYMYKNPQAPRNILALLNLDMVGDHQVRSESILRLYRTPDSLPSFVNDVVQEMFDWVAAGNNISIRDRALGEPLAFRLPIVDPSGSRDPFYYSIEDFWGPSDHEDVADASLGVDAVLLNTWPDPYIGTQEDTVERADATQMKRAMVIAGGAAYILATAGAKELPLLTENAQEKARARLAREERRAFNRLATVEGAAYPEAQNLIAQAYRREAAALASLRAFAETPEAQSYLDGAVRDLEGGEAVAQSRLGRHADLLEKARGVKLERGKPAPAATASRVPVRRPEIRGPVNFFRPEYGEWWLAERLGDPRFRDSLRLASRGHYYLYETLNFADGKRNLGEIRDAVAAEYGPAPLEEIEQYFQLLERAGVVTLR